MKIKIIRTPRISIPPLPASDIRVMKLWNELNPNDGFSSARGQPEGQVQGQQALYTPYLVKDGIWAGSWGANQNSPSISNVDVLRIASLQTADEFSVDTKMAYIMAGGGDKWGQAIRATFPSASRWREATNIKMNQCVYAGNKVEVLERKVMTVDTFGTIPMLRIRTGWDQVHIYTGVTDSNAHIWKSKGYVYLPLLPKAGYDWWILERWTKPL